MQVKYLSSDGVYFDSPEDCLEHEQQTKPLFKMWDDYGVTTSSRYARVVWLSSNGGADAFIKMSNKEEAPIDGIDEWSTGTFIWNDESFVWVQLEDETMQAICRYFEDTK